MVVVGEDRCVARKKKKHVCSCGETFPHGIGLRKHQRQTGHKGSEIVEEGAPKPPPTEEPVATSEAEPAPPDPRPESVAPQSAPPPEPEPEPDETVVVNQRPSRRSASKAAQREEPSSSANASSAGTDYHQAPQPLPVQEGPSRLQHNRQKLSLIGRGLKVLFAYRAKTAGKQLKQSARSGADIFAEAAKLAAALICLLGIPAMLIFWWKSGQSNTRRPQNPPMTFNFEDGPLAARSSVLRYLDNIGKKNWQAAYGQLSPSWQGEMTASRFRDAFLDIEDLRWAVNTQTVNEKGQAIVSVRLAFIEGGQRQRFLANFRLERSGKDWRIDRAEFSPESNN